MTKRGVVLGLLSAALLAALPACGEPGINPQPVTVASGVNGLVAFVGTPERNGEIYVVAPDGTGERRLTRNQASEDSLVWSPDGRRIAFVRSTPLNRSLPPEFDIWVMEADGTGQRRLTTNPYSDFDPVWSPDGSRIAFTSRRDGHNFEIYVMNADGSAQTRLTRSLASSNPTWSPDGTQIAYDTALVPFEDDSAISVIHTDGSAPRAITAGSSDEHPVWSPDGSLIVFTRSDYGNPANAGLYVVRSDGSGLRKLVDLQVTGPGPSASWSPNGRKLVFSMERNGAAHVFVVNADGSGLARLTTMGQNFEPTWSPDGDQIAFSRCFKLCGRGSDIYVTTVAGGKERRLTRSPTGEYEPAWQHLPSGG